MSSRGGFSSRIGFIAAAAGSAVGLGNIWGFPYEVGEGGGAIFVLIYLFFCFALCLPVMISEIAIGRSAKKNAVGAFNKLGHRNWNFIGKLGILSGVLILSFYNVIAGWAFGYVIEIGSGNFKVADDFGGFTADAFRMGVYGFFFMLATAYIVSQGISSGIEKAAKILLPLLIFMMISMVIYSLTLPDSMAGLEFYLIPDFSDVNGKVVFNAMGQAFFSLSLGMGALITYGSYLGKSENIISSAVLITLADVGIAFLAGLMIFPLIGYITGGTMENAGRGPALIFVTLPHIFGDIGGMTGIVVGTGFFLLLCFAALTSTVSLLEVPVAYLVDELRFDRKKAVWLMAGIIYLLGLPSLVGNGYSEFFTSFITYGGSDQPVDFLSFIVNVANDSFLPLGGCLIVFFASHIWKKRNLDAELAEGNPGYEGSLLQKYLKFALPYLIPLALAVIFVMTVLSTFFGIGI